LTKLTAGRRLCLATCSPLPYDRSRVTPGIVHLGVGAFHRAHIAAYIDDILPSDPTWGIIGASLQRPDVRDALAPQDYLYTHVTRGPLGEKTRVIGSLLNILVASQQKRELIEVMTDPRVRIVSLTITEKGYCHDPARGVVDRNHPDIRHDLSELAAPVSAPGLIVRALALRRDRGIAPFTVLSCDNLPENGRTTKRIVTGYAALLDPALADFIAKSVSFPSTMVDRIVPATTASDRQFVLEETGLDDAWPVVTEPFTQWVIEDDFTLGRPDFEAVGAQLVSDVTPFELMKLRMLNGSHSTMAYLGYLAGFETVSETIAEPAFRLLIDQLMTLEVMPTLTMKPKEMALYRDALLDRFGNPALRHRTWQIAMDGSQKLPQRLLGTIRDLRAKKLPARRATLGVAAWMQYVTGIDEQGREIDVRDPLAEKLKAIAGPSIKSPANLVDGLLGVTEIFGNDLCHPGSLRANLISDLNSFCQVGVRETVRNIASASYQLESGV
jgi:fructuronate reductase